MPRPPSDVFRPRLPLDPFAAVDVRAPWLVPPNLPHSPPQVILILGEPPPSELLPLLTSPHLARSLLLIASHAPPALPLLPPTTPGPTVRILHLAAPLAIHNAGALRLVALLEKAHRVAARWRLQVSSSSHHALSHPHLLTSASSASLASSSWGGGAGPSKHRGGGGGGAWSGPGSAADRVVQLAESLKTGEFSIVELVVYLPPPPTSFPPTTTATSAAADAAGAWSAAGPGGVGPPAMKMMSSADPRSRDNKPKPKNTDNNRHQGPSQIQGSGTPARSSPTALPTPQIPNPSLNVQRPGGQHHQPEDNAHRYPSPAPSVTESLSSSTTSHAAPSASLGARPKLDSGSVSKNSKRFLTLSPSSTTPDISPPSTPSRPTSSYSVSSFLSANGAQQASGKPRKLRRNSRSSTSSLSVSSSMSHSTHNNAAASISPFAAPHPTEAKRGSSYSKSKKGAKDALGGESGRAFDAILNFLPAGVPDKQLLKHAILVTTLGVRYLESEDLGHHHHPHSSYAPAHSQRHPQSRSSPLPTGHYDTYSGSAAGYASDTTASVRLNTKSSRRFTALSIFSAFAGSSSSSNLSTPESSVPSSPGVGVRSTPDLLAVGMGGSASSSRSGSVLSLVVGGGVGGGGGGGGGRKKGRSQSSYHAPSAFSLHANALSNVNANVNVNGDEGAEVEVDTDAEVGSMMTSTTEKDKERKEKRKSVRKRISAFLGGGSGDVDVAGTGGEGKGVKRPESVYGSSVAGSRNGYGLGRVEEREMGLLLGGSGGFGREGGQQQQMVMLTAHIVHILPGAWVDGDSLSLQPLSRPSSSTTALSPPSSRRNSAVALNVNANGNGNGKPKLVQSVEQFLLSFAYPLGSLGALGSSSHSSTHSSSHSSSHSSPSSSSRGKEKERERENISIGISAGGRPLRPPPSAYPGAGSRSSSGSSAGSGVGVEQSLHSQSQSQSQSRSQSQEPPGGRLAALAKQHSGRPVPYLVAPGVWACAIADDDGDVDENENEAGMVIPRGESITRPRTRMSRRGMMMTVGEALLLGALDVDPVTGSRAGTGRAWVGVGDVRFVGGAGVGSVGGGVGGPSMPAPAPAFLPVPGSVQGQGKLQSQSQFQSQSQSQFQFQGHALDPAGGPDRHHRPHVHPHPHLHSSAAGTGAYVHPLARVVSEDEEGGETPVQAKFAASTTAKFTTSASNKKFTTSTSNKFATSTSSASDMRVQLPTPPESGSSSGESVVDEEVGDAEEEGDDSESTARAGDGEVTPPAQQSKPKPDMWIDTDPTTPTTTTLARRPTRNHRPAPPPPSVPSPVRAALETLAMSPKDAAPPAMIVVDASAASAIPTTSIAAGVGASIVAAAAIVGASAVAAQPTPPSAFPAMKGSVGISEHLTNMEEARPARPRTVHVSDAQRRAPPMLGGSASVGAGGNGSGGVGGLHRTASQSTSALLRGSGGKAAAGVSELGEKSGNGTGKEKGYAHGLQAAWRKIAVWRGGREKGALRG